MINKITVTRVHGCTVHSEPSVMVAKRVEVTREVSVGGVVEYWQQLLQSDAVALEIALLPWTCQLKAPAG